MEPTKRYKTFDYSTGTRWVRDRLGELSSEGKPTFEVGSPPEFKGEAGKWTPEDLFVAAIDVCQMTTFLAFAARKSVDLRSYESSAKGLLEFAGGGYRFTKVTLTPRIVVASGTSKDDVLHLVDDAHKNCLIGRSVTAEIDVQPQIEFA